MSDLFQIEALGQRFRKYVALSEIKPESSRLLEEALMRGEYDRGEAARITGLPERSARRVLNDVVAERLLASGTPKGPVSLRFPTETLQIFFPRLYVQA
jgi:Fic family protein